MFNVDKMTIKIIMSRNFFDFFYKNAFDPDTELADAFYEDSS